MIAVCIMVMDAHRTQRSKISSVRSSCSASGAALRSLLSAAIRRKKKRACVCAHLPGDLE